jgi:excisionase family DNA binding protein
MGVENRQLLRAEEAAHLLGIGRTRIYQMIPRGEVPVLRIGWGPPHQAGPVVVSASNLELAWMCGLNRGGNRNGRAVAT